MNELILIFDDFQGPLDLLLHLVKEKEMDILKLDLQLITDQFLAFIFQEHNLKLDQIGEYLPIAAYLIELQTKKLLPDPIEAEVDSEYEAEINRQKLINRILEYKKFKEVTSFFTEQALKRRQLFSKDISDFKQFSLDQPATSLFVKNNVDQLGAAMVNLWKQLQAENKLPVKLNLNLISAEDRALEIKQMLKKTPDKVFSLTELFTVADLSLHYFVITFIAILDLANHQYLAIVQKQHYGPIMLQYRKGEQHAKN